MMDNDSFKLGKTSDDDYYGMGSAAALTKEEISELEDYGVPLKRDWQGVRALSYAGGGIQGVKSMALVPGSLEEQLTSHFEGTYADSSHVVHLEAQAVVTLADGHRMPISVTCISSFQEVLEDALSKTPMGGIMQQRVKSSQVHSIPNRY